MGCYPLGKMVSKAFWKCSGKEKRRSSRMVKLSPPPSYLYSGPRTVVKSVNFSNQTPIVIIPPDPIPPVTLPKPHPAVEAPTHHPIGPTTAATSSAAAPASHETAAESPQAVCSPPRGPVQKEPVQFLRGPPNCYVMSPLPRWEERPRRREYFSGDCYYYPTPIREGIYNIGTDPTRLTAIFSEENPNACTIV